MTPRSAATKPLPKHIQTLIETNTGLSYEKGSLKRTARMCPCRRCGAWTLAGLDGDRIAFDVYLDPTPLSALGEAIVLLGNEMTWSVRARVSDGRREIDPREACNIRRRPAGTAGLDIHAVHRCGRILPGELVTASTLPQRRLGDQLPIDPEF